MNYFKRIKYEIRYQLNERFQYNHMNTWYPFRENKHCKWCEETHPTRKIPILTCIKYGYLNAKRKR